MAGYETKALLLSVLRYVEVQKDPELIKQFIEDLLHADGYESQRKKQTEGPDPNGRPDRLSE